MQVNWYVVHGVLIFPGVIASKAVQYAGQVTASVGSEESRSCCTAENIASTPSSL